jgi:hypothetical protein
MRLQSCIVQRALLSGETVLSKSSFLFAILAMSCLVGCAGTGGTLDNLVPLPKILKGKVVNSTYYAPGGAFQIETPHPTTGYEWLYGKVKEGSDAQLQFVEFGPFAFDLNTYSVDVVPAQPGHSVEEVAKHWWEQKTRQGEFEQLVQASVELNRKRAYYSAYRAKGTNYIIVSTFIDFDGKYANVFAVVNPQSGMPVSAEDIIQRNWKRYNDYAGSLNIPGEPK